MFRPQARQQVRRTPATTPVRRVWLAAVAIASVTCQVPLAAGQETRGASTGARQSRPMEAIALVGGSVVDVVGGVTRPDHVVEVAGGRIRAVVPRRAWRRTRAVRVVSVEGRYIVPGLWDMHVEQALPLWDREPLDSNASFFHPLLLAAGVTGVRDVAGDLTVLGRWQEEIAQGHRVGPRLVYSGPKVGMAAPARGLAVPPASAADAAATMGALAAGGSRIAYLYTAPAAVLDALAQEAARRRLSLEGNVPFTSSLRQQVARGQRVIDHLDGVLLASSVHEASDRRTLQLIEAPTWWARWGWKLGLMTRPPFPPALPLAGYRRARADSVAALLAAGQVYQVPTLRMLGVLNRSGDSAVRLPPPEISLKVPRTPWNGWPAAPHPADHPLARLYVQQLEAVGTMHRAGVPILAGSDTPNLYAAPGSSLHDELALLVRAGLSPLEALRSATWRPAQYLGATDSLGAVAPGFVADLVILTADPLRDIGALRGTEQVMLRGVLYPADTLAAWRARATAKGVAIAAYWRNRTRGER